MNYESESTQPVHCNVHTCQLCTLNIVHLLDMIYNTVLAIQCTLAVHNLQYYTMTTHVSCREYPDLF